MHILSAATHLAVKNFWMAGMCSSPTSVAISPRAIINPKLRSKIASMCCSARGFSILGMIFGCLHIRVLRRLRWLVCSFIWFMHSRVVYSEATPLEVFVHLTRSVAVYSCTVVQYALENLFIPFSCWLCIVVQCSLVARYAARLHFGDQIVDVFLSLDKRNGYVVHLQVHSFASVHECLPQYTSVCLSTLSVSLST